MGNRGITSYGVYLPRLRLERAAIAAAHAWSMPALTGLGKGERTVAGWDEDSITMAVEALRGCGVGGDATSLCFASTTPVYADLQNASLVAAATGLRGEIATADAGGSLRAGTTALRQALESVQSGDALVVAADNRIAKPGSTQEMHYGAGAAALRIGEDPIARYLGGVSTSVPFIDHFRAAGRQHDYVWEERWVRDEGYLKIVPNAIAAVLEQTGLSAAQIDHFILPGSVRGIAASVAKCAGIAADAVVDNLAAGCGDTGSPHALIMLAGVLEQARPGERILVASFATGCDALLFETTDSIANHRSPTGLAAALAGGASEAHYTKLLSFHGQLDLDWGMRAETDAKTALTELYRSSDQINAFVAGECAACGAVQFPQLAACVACASAAGFKPHPLADEPARVVTFTADWLQYYPSPPLVFGLVQFDSGARVLMEMVDTDPGTLDVGTPLRMVFRVKLRDARRGFSRYFWKATPVTNPAGD